MTDTLYERVFASTLENLALVLPEALDALQAAGCVSAENRHCLRLCLEEGLVNAVKHGNAGDASREVALAITTDADSVWICIRDEGGGFDPKSVPEPEPAQKGGRGVCLMRHFMDEVDYDTDEGCLRMRLNRGAATGTKGLGDE